MNLSRTSRVFRFLPVFGVSCLAVAAACSAAHDDGGRSAAEAAEGAQSQSDLSTATADAGVCSPAIDQFRELEIVHPNVVNDKRASNALDGHWSFRFLVEQMAPAGTDPSAFVLAMLRTWETQQVVNGVTLEARPAIDSQVITPWLTASGGVKLDLAKAPFKLMAITNRLDLHAPDCSNAGEGRFVFNVTDPSGNALPFTFIFEYHLPTTATVTPHVWAQRWHRLHAFDITQLDTTADDAGAAPDSYNEELQAITDLFAKRGALPSAPNGNAISQVRTNEIALSSPWQLREFHLVANAQGQGFLVPATTAQAPTQTLNDSQTLHDFISDNKAAVNNGTIKMPLTYTDTINGVTRTVSLLGGESNEDGARWQSPDPTTPRNPLPIDSATLTNFTFLTCNGCHNLENVGIGSFYHVDPFIQGKADGGVGAGSERLSPFLLGNPSANPPIPSDLARRAKVMQGLLCSTSCPAVPLVSGTFAARIE